MAEPDTQPSASGATPTPTLRLRFVYHGQEITFAGSRSVRMIIPPSVSPPPEKDQTGYWFEVHDPDGKVLFHRALHSPIRVDSEVFSHEGTQSITRVPIAEPAGEFEMLVPDLPGAHSLVLYGPPAESRLPALAGGELLRVTFEELRKPPPDRPATGPGTPKPGVNRR